MQQRKGKNMHSLSYLFSLRLFEHIEKNAKTNAYLQTQHKLQKTTKS